MIPHASLLPPPQHHHLPPCFIQHQPRSLTSFPIVNKLPSPFPPLPPLPLSLTTTHTLPSLAPLLYISSIINLPLSSSPTHSPTLIFPSYVSLSSCFHPRLGSPSYSSFLSFTFISPPPSLRPLSPILPCCLHRHFIPFLPHLTSITPSPWFPHFTHPPSPSPIRLPYLYLAFLTFTQPPSVRPHLYSAFSLTFTPPPYSPSSRSRPPPPPRPCSQPLVHASPPTLITCLALFAAAVWHQESRHPGVNVLLAAVRLSASHIIAAAQI